MVSIGVHALIIVIAISFVAVTVIKKEEQKFEVTTVARPKMNLKKLQVPVKIKKKTSAPKLRKRILSVPKRNVQEIKMPEVVGIKGGLGNMGGAGLDGVGFSLGEMDLFGGSKSFGNELSGSFYDLKQTMTSEPTGITIEEYDEVLFRFLRGWDERHLSEKYFRAPNSKFAIAFIMPEMSASAAPKAFGVGDVVKPMQWLAYYKGQISAPETGKYRFCGMGDDVLYVRVKRKLVLDASWSSIYGKAGWTSDEKREFKLGHGTMVVGDWISLKKGVPVSIEVLIGERPGGKFGCQLLIEQKGGEYKMVGSEENQRPILPIFKLKDIPDEVVKKMKVNSNQITVEGPIFGTAKAAVSSRPKSGI